MANTRSANVIIVDTSAAFAIDARIKTIKYVAGTGSPSASIKKTDNSGVVLWEGGASSATDEVCVRSTQGIYVTVAGTGTKVYIYLK